jgi:carbamoyltransferase
MIVLGINEDHNGSAALVQGGKVLACASEERYTRLKNDVGYPRLAIDSILKATGVRPEQIDRVAISTLEQDPVQLKIKRVARYKVSDYVNEMYDYWKPVLLEGRPSDYWDAVQADARLGSPEGVHYDFGFMKRLPREEWPAAFREERQKVVERHLGLPAEKIRFVDHHRGHAYYAYFAAPIDRSRKTAVITADGWGDGCNGSVSLAQGDSVREIHRTSLCNVPRIYRWITLLLGMKPNEHEYKVMGLAPYAKDYVRSPAYEILKETLVVDGLDFKWNVKPSDSYFYFKERFERAGVRFDGIGGGLQHWVEEIVSQWVTNVMTHVGADQLVMGGGLAMNVKANKVLCELPAVKDFFVTPSPGDESLCMGAAFVESAAASIPVPLPTVYLGHEPSAEEVAHAMAQFGAAEKFLVEAVPTPERVAQHLVDGKVLARCVGPMEFGARALGNRSILCDPSKWDHVRKINEKIKSRDFWMPFAATILAERADDYIVNPKGLKAPFMTLAFDGTPLARQHLPAAMHPYDFTVRPQILERKANPGYYDIIKAFEARTGIGALLNTSFNLHGEPIVCTARDALHTFVRSGLDGLLFAGVLLLKKD